MKTKILLFMLSVLLIADLPAQKKKVIIDADTGNEIDDIPAIALAVMSDKVEIVGIVAAQWNRVEVCGRNTMMEGWELNNRTLEYLDKVNIPSLKGAEEMVGRQWAIYPARPSEGADFIIKNALATKDGEKLNLIVTGAATNIASAIMIEPAIVDKIAVYFIGTKYNFEKNAMNKNEFNVRNDLNAFDILLDTEGLDLHVMPANVTTNLVFSKEEIYQLKGDSKLGDLIVERWETIASEFDEWIMWDIGIVQAFLHPEWAQQEIRETPPENKSREIYIYRQIDAEKMKQNFWETYKTYFH